MTVCVSILEFSLVFLTGTFKTKGAKDLASVKGLYDVLRSGQDNQSGRADTTDCPIPSCFYLRCVHKEMEVIRSDENKYGISLSYDSRCI